MREHWTKSTDRNATPWKVRRDAGSSGDDGRSAWRKRQAMREEPVRDSVWLPAVNCGVRGRKVPGEQRFRNNRQGNGRGRNRLAVARFVGSRLDLGAGVLIAIRIRRSVSGALEDLQPRRVFPGAMRCDRPPHDRESQRHELNPPFHPGRNTGSGGHRQPAFNRSRNT
jgi:hypothetical protein